MPPLVGDLAVAIGAIFKSDARDLIERVRTKSYGSPDEKRALYDELSRSTSVKIAEAMPFVFALDSELRVAVGDGVAGDFRIHEVHVQLHTRVATGKGAQHWW